MVLFGFPLERNGYTAAHRTILHAAADELKLPLIDPQPEFERMPASQGWYFPKDKGHANAEGNKAIAERVAAFLIENKLVP
jgi:lysophospholipase L1-like esterase